MKLFSNWTKTIVTISDDRYLNLTYCWNVALLYRVIETVVPTYNNHLKDTKIETSCLIEIKIEIFRKHILNHPTTQIYAIQQIFLHT